MIYSEKTRQAAYSIRFMGSLALCLFLACLAFNVRWPIPSRTTEWRFSRNRSLQAMGFNDIGVEAAYGLAVTASASEGTATAALAPNSTQDEQQQEVTIPVEEPEPPSSPTLLSKVHHMPILDFVEDMPQVAGGLAAYYIHIEYPEEALMQGIQGRLVLKFIVEPDGSTSDVQVAEGLHPLCDSAAVHALRRTTFIPGRHQGQMKRVRMRLPVRFMLVSPDSSDTATG